MLRQGRFFAGRPVHADGTKDIAWFGPDGTEMDHARWHDPGLRVLQMYLHAVALGDGAAPRDESLLVVLQGAADPQQVRLPGRPWARDYRLLWDSADERPPEPVAPGPAGPGVQGRPRTPGGGASPCASTAPGTDRSPRRRACHPGGTGRPGAARGRGQALAFVTSPSSAGVASSGWRGSTRTV